MIKYKCQTVLAEMNVGSPYPTRKMTVFGAIFEVNSNFGKLWDFLGHLGKKDTDLRF